MEYQTSQPPQGYPIQGQPVFVNPQKTSPKRITCAIIAAIVVLLVIILGPNALEKQRKKARAEHAISTCKILRNSVLISSDLANRDDKSWENGTTDFGPHFSYVQPPQGYTFFYTSNDYNMDGVHEATKWLYVGVPNSFEDGNVMVGVDENCEVFTVELKKEDFKNLPQPGYKPNWQGSWEKNEKGVYTWNRIPGYQWKKNSK